MSRTFPVYIVAAALVFLGCHNNYSLDPLDGGINGDKNTGANAGADTDTERNGPLLDEGDACDVDLSYGASMLKGVCAPTDGECEGGFSSAIPPELVPSHNCRGSLDCCVDTDQCFAMSLKLGEQISKGTISSCISCDEFQSNVVISVPVGCPGDHSTCCIATSSGQGGPTTESPPTQRSPSPW